MLNNKLKPLNILLTGAGSEGVYGMIKSFRKVNERDIRLIGVDINPFNANRFMLDEFYLVPKRYDHKFIPAIRKIIKKSNIDVLFPVPTNELEIFASHNFDILVVGNSLESLKIANHKDKLYKFLERNYPECCPRHKNVKNFDEFFSVVHEFGYPKNPVCFRKPFGMGAEGVRILNKNIDHLDILLNQSPNSTITTLEMVSLILKEADLFPTLIVQEYLPGDEYDVDVLSGKGKVLSVIPRKNLKMLWGLSWNGYTEKNEEIIELAKKIVEKIGLKYVNSLTFKLNANGHPKLLEINPRIPGSIIIDTEAGVNMPYFAIKLALGEKLPEFNVKWGTYMLRYYGDYCVPGMKASKKIIEV